MKLHTVQGSPNSHRVEAVIDHLGLDVEIVQHDFGALRHSDYLAVNPNAKVPTLVDGAFTLWESNAIMQYLADKAGSNALFPRDPQSRADIMRWQCWELAHFNRAFGTLAFEIIAKPRLQLGPSDERAIEQAKLDLTRFAPVLDGHLKGRRYLVGEHISIADYAMITFEYYRDKVGFDWAAYPALNAYFDRMRLIESWVRTAPNLQARVA